MNSNNRSLISGLAALNLVLLALGMLWVPLVVTSRWAGIGWWVWLLWVVAAPVGLLLAGAWVLAWAAVSSAAVGSGAGVPLPSRRASGKLAPS
jgi:hypothetical protein